MKDKKMPGQKNLPTLTVYSFYKDFEIEAYVYEKDEDNDGFTFDYKVIMDGTKSCNYLTAAGFNEYLYRRKLNSKNEQLLNGKNFPRNMLIRDVSDLGGSSKLTRTDGLDALKQFFMDPDFTRFPPRDIMKVDDNREEDPHALDEFFMDEDIKLILEREFNEEDLNREFYKNYNQLAKKIWSGKFFPDYAIDELGYPPF